MAVARGRVTVGGAPAATPARLVTPGEPLAVRAPRARFVGRGGEKLDAALDRFPIDVAGLRVLDAGASTGGFTDCLLQRGAAAVVAVDVGRNQLHERLRADPRVITRERTDLRRLDLAAVGGPFPLVVADLSFISLVSVADALLAACAPGAELVLLVKPQFEATPQEAARGRGVITDPAIWRRALARVDGALGQRGAAIMAVMASPLRGADGNVEFAVHVAAPGHPNLAASDPVDLGAAVTAARAASAPTPDGP